MNDPGRLEGIRDDGACWDGVRGGGSREGYIKAVCFPDVFLSFSPYRLCPSIATEVVFGFLHVALFSRPFFFFLSRYIEGGQKEEYGSLFSFTPLGRMLFWLCKVLYKALFTSKGASGA